MGFYGLIRTCSPATLNSILGVQLNESFTKAFFIMWCWWTPCQETSQTCLLSEDSFVLKIFLVRKLRIFSFLSKWFCPAHLFMDINVFAFPYVVGLLFWFGLFFSFSHSSPLLPLCPFFWFVSGGDSMGKAKDSPFCGKKKKSLHEIVFITNMLPFSCWKWTFFSYYVSVNKQLKIMLFDQLILTL